MYLKSNNLMIVLACDKSEKSPPTVIGSARAKANLLVNSLGDENV